MAQAGRSYMNDFIQRKWFPNIGQYLGGSDPGAIAAPEIDHIQFVGLDLESAVLARDSVVLDTNIRMTSTADYHAVTGQLNHFSPTIWISYL
jgi:hypothetical protein